MRPSTDGQLWFSYVIDLPEGAVDLLRGQCALFKRKTLHKAFKEAFITGAGPLKLVEQV